MKARFDLDDVHPVAAVADPAARRAAARARWPELGRLVDDALAAPSKVTRIPAPRLLAALLCAGDRAQELAAADRRHAAEAALDELAYLVRHRGPLTMYVARTDVPLLVDGRITLAGVAELLPHDDDPASAVRHAVQLVATELGRRPHPPFDDDVVELCHRYLAGEFGLVSPDEMHLLDSICAQGAVALAARLEPLDLYGVHLASTMVGRASNRRALWQVLCVQPDAAREVADAVAAGRLAPWPTAQLTDALVQMLDAVIGDAAAPTVAAHLDEGVLRVLRSPFDLVTQLRSPRIVEACLDAVEDGRLDRFDSDDVWRWLEARGTSHDRFGALSEGASWQRWLADADDAGLARWAVSPSALDAPPWGFLTWGQERRAYAALVEHHRGLCAAVVGDEHYAAAGLRAAALDALADAVGDDELAWRQVWALAPAFPGTVGDLVAVVRASS